MAGLLLGWLHLAQQPGAGHLPVALHGDRRDAELLRGLFEDDDLPEASQAELTTVDGKDAAIVDGILGLLREGIATGAFRPVSARHTLQTLIGATVYHFASGDLGENLLGRPLLSAEAVRHRKEEVRGLMRLGLLADPQPARGEPS